MYAQVDSRDRGLMPTAEIIANSLELRETMLLIKQGGCVMAVQMTWELRTSGMGRRTVVYMGLN